MGPSPCPRLAALPALPSAGGLRVHVAATRRARRQGLAGLEASALHRDAALWLTPCRSVHTAGMRFPLDLVWLDARSRVLAVDPGVAPRRVRTRLRARSVLETHAGCGAAVAAAWSTSPRAS